LPSGSEEGELWRDTVEYSLSWERWEEFAREETRRLMDL
jgi:hypothetical protein